MGHLMEEVEDPHGASLERGEETPLLQQSNSSGQYDSAVSSGDDGQLISLHHRCSDWRATASILGYKCLEGIAYTGIRSNLVIYLSSIFHETIAASATDASAWSGTTYFTPLIGAIVADTCLGRYWAVLAFTLVYLLGMVMVTLTACLPFLTPPPCRGSFCPSATTAQKLVFFGGIYLVAFGCGAAKSSLIPLGAEQFYDENPIDRKRKELFFSLFYLCLTVGNLVASTIVVWMQENVSWASAYGLETLCVALAFGGFLLGTPFLRLVRPGGSPLKSVAQVLVASFRKMHLDVPKDDSLLYAVNHKNIGKGLQQLAHTDAFRFLDKAAIVSDSDMSNGFCRNKWALCTVTQVEELKIILRLIPIWISSVIYNAAISQIYTTFVEQGNAMNTRIGSFSIPPASLQAFQGVCTICLTAICNKILIPITVSYTGSSRGHLQLQRMGVGHMLMVIAMALAAILEAERLGSVRAGESLSIAWQLPQYFVVACSEVFCIIAQLEFFYDQAPDTMKSMCTSFLLLSVSMGSYLIALMISFVMFLTTRGGQPGWLPGNLDEGHLDYFFWSLAALSALNFLSFLTWASKYTLKKVVLEG